MEKFDLNSSLPKISRCLSKQKDIAAAYLFGSYATGRQRPNSDLDIGILFSERPQSYNRLFQIASDIEKEIQGPKVDVREFDLSDSPVFLMSALKKSRLIYEGSPLKRIFFEVDARREYNDTKRLREIQYYYLQQRIKEKPYADQH